MGLEGHLVDSEMRLVERARVGLEGHSETCLLERARHQVQFVEPPTHQVMLKWRELVQC